MTSLDPRGLHAYRTAACSCGQLKLHVRGEQLGVGVCHCLECQRRTGSVFATLAAFSPPYQVRGQVSEYVRRGDGGTAFRFRFCPTCGSNLFHTEDGLADSAVLVAVGAFADPNFPPPEDSIYDSRRHAWVRLPAATKVYDTEPA